MSLASIRPASESDCFHSVDIAKTVRRVDSDLEQGLTSDAVDHRHACNRRME